MEPQVVTLSRACWAILSCNWRRWPCWREMGQSIVRSSAYSAGGVEGGMVVVRSEMYIAKRVAASIDPCGTEFSRGKVCE